MAGRAASGLIMGLFGSARQGIDRLDELVRQPLAPKRIKGALTPLNHGMEHCDDPLVLRGAGVHDAERMKDAGLACLVLLISKGCGRHLHRAPQSDASCPCDQGRPDLIGHPGAAASRQSASIEPNGEATDAAARVNHLVLTFAEHCR